MGFHEVFADNTNPASVASRLRRRRFELFLGVARRLPAPVRVLDVGGTVGYWDMTPAGSLDHLQVTLLNLSPVAVDHPQLTACAGDARDLGCFPVGAFDIVFSNSVIEHVGDRSDQQRMADEIRRVGAFYYVQTPNRAFPIEPHFQFPLFQFLPLSIRTRLVQRFDLGWYRRIPDREAARAHVESIRLLTRRELAALFPEARLFRERFLGMVKSLVAFTEPEGGPRWGDV